MIKKINFKFVQNAFSIMGMAALISLIIWFFVGDFFVNYIFEQQKKEEKIGIGMKVDPEFMLFDRAGLGHSIQSQFRNGLVIMIYSPTCAPCREAASEAEERFRQEHESNQPAFAILQFADKLDSKLVRLKGVQVFTSKLRRSESPFSGSSTPTFYKIDSNGLLRQKKVGFYDGILDELLMPPVGIKK